MEYEKPEYSFAWDDDNKEPVSAEKTDINALTKKILTSMNPAPIIDDLPDTSVILPAGAVIKGEVKKNAEVRELTGEHEERLAKARATGNGAKFLTTLLQCGVVSIGDQPVTSEMLDGLLQGDLDALILGIRRATFGDKFELFEIACDTCGEKNDIEMDLKDIPMSILDNSAERTFLVDLRKGRKAKVQFPTGAVQQDIFKKEISIPEMNSITLAHCVLSFIEADGAERPCNGLNDVKKLGLQDRKSLQKFIYEEQPGPRYDKVIAACPSCEGEVPVPMGVGVLFREI